MAPLRCRGVVPIGRTAVSKTDGWEFESLRPCHLFLEKCEDSKPLSCGFFVSEILRPELVLGARTAVSALYKRIDGWEFESLRPCHLFLEKCKDCKPLSCGFFVYGNAYP